MTILSVSPSESDVFAALRTFLLEVLPSGTAQYSGWIAGTTLTVEAFLPTSAGPISDGDAVLGIDVLYGTTVVQQLTGTAGGVGTYEISPSQSAGTVDQALTLSSGVEVVQFQDNRVPSPAISDYVGMTPLSRPRLATNVDEIVDVTFSGSIADTTLTASAVVGGLILNGSIAWGVGAQPARIVRQLTGTPGGAGTYLVAPSQTVGQVAMAAGYLSKTESVDVGVQIQVFGPNSGNFATIVSALFRDGYAVDAINALLPAATPLHADDPRQLAFDDGEDQFENRWTIDMSMQVDFTVSVSQQFADALTIATQSVETLPTP